MKGSWNAAVTAGLVLAVSLVGVGTPASAQAGRMTAFEALRESAEAIRAQAKNARTRARVGMTGFDRRAVERKAPETDGQRRPEGRAPSYARKCCGANIDAMAQLVIVADKAAERLREERRALRRAESSAEPEPEDDRGAVTLARIDGLVEQLSGLVAVLQSADNKDRAISILENVDFMVRTLDEQLDAYDECCVEDPEPGTNQQVLSEGRP